MYHQNYKKIEDINKEKNSHRVIATMECTYCRRVRHTLPNFLILPIRSYSSSMKKIHVTSTTVFIIFRAKNK